MILFLTIVHAAQGLKTGVDGQSLMVFGVYFVLDDTTFPSTMSSTMVFTMTVLVELLLLLLPPPPPPPLKLVMVAKREYVDACSSEIIKTQWQTHTHFTGSLSIFLPACFSIHQSPILSDFHLQTGLDVQQHYVILRLSVCVSSETNNLLLQTCYVSLQLSQLHGVPRFCVPKSCLKRSFL